MSRATRDPTIYFRDDKWMASSVYEGIITHGFRIGHLVGVRESLVAAAKPLLGPPSKHVRQALETIEDPDRLLRMCAAVVGSHTWVDVLSVE
jgi:hypothetical protein